MLKSYREHHALSALLWLLCLTLSPGAWAHEFWIEPVDFSIPAGGKLQARVRVGQEMKGNSLPLSPQSFEQFDVTSGDVTRPVYSRIGDDPAVNEPLEDDGLVILSCVSTDSQITYSEAGKFENFLAYEGIDWVLEEHRRRQLPAQGFSEGFQRFAKSLVQVGGGAGKDRPLGLLFELVAETNPYTAPDSDIVVQLLWQGEPFGNAQINVFRRLAGVVERTAVTTDVTGHASIPRGLGAGVYLLNAVHMIEPPPSDDDIVWKSLWASMTFEIAD